MGTQEGIRVKGENVSYLHGERTLRQSFHVLRTVNVLRQRTSHSCFLPLWTHGLGKNCKVSLFAPLSISVFIGHKFLTSIIFFSGIGQTCLSHMEPKVFRLNVLSVLLPWKDPLATSGLYFKITLTDYNNNYNCKLIFFVKLYYLYKS